MVSSVEDAQRMLSEKIDYDKVDASLAAYRQVGVDFLNKIS